ncbi:MAG: T9SS C-terminal target domain-containing protein [Bacteroidetes bacterium]|nr:MAG: T9SS C-terminal target domain-containing protein [Bacteroidota bacterium]
MKVTFTNRHWLAFAMLWAFSGLWAQQLTPLDMAHRYLQENYKQWNLTESDVSDVRVNDYYTNDKTGISYVYFLQTYQDIGVYNAILNVHLKGGKVVHHGNRFVSNLAEKVNTTVPALTAESAVLKVAAHYGVPTGQTPRLLSQEGQRFTFEKGEMAREDIPVELLLQPKDGEVRLAWNMVFVPVGTHDRWNVSVDAVSGEIIHEYNWTVYCNLPDEGGYLAADRNYCPEEAHQHGTATMDMNLLSDGAKYNVWPSPYESPIHGPRTLVEDPADVDASPYGWHDVDGSPGHEFTITRGNNAWAYQDRDDNLFSLGDEPDGGDSLLFDFPWQFDWEPQQYLDAAVTNLFYWSNLMHDFSWHMGFDELAGNFQQNNYGNGGLDGDAIEARAQAGANTGSENNAFYSGGADGSGASINMFIWNTGGDVLTVDEPASVAGPIATGAAAGGWGDGAQVSDVPVTGEVVIVNDGVDDPFATDGCEDLLNADELVGKIALIDRGGCEFGCKALRAQEAGAIGVIICNFEDALIGMAGGQCGPDVQIPTLFASSVSCQTIRQFAGNGLKVTMVAPGQLIPMSFDGDLDNGIIAHEYGHGISGRSTGGPSVNCLGNAEQMGEGWSDFMTLVTAVQPGDTGEMPRGVGTYTQREDTNGRGIRTFPYSTDMNVNPHTYADIASLSIPHGVGSVWCAMLWDMYWAFVDEYGWDPDIYNGTGGNNMAVRLVFEAMKIQPCSPGFVDGRDAILAADELLYDGANQCMIWEVFARRGLGYSADQGDSDNAADGVEAFDPHPFCVPELKITKEATELIKAGDEIEVTVRVIHHKPEPVTGVVVTDELPVGLTYVPGSANIDPVVNGNLLSFELGDLDFDVERVITYRLKSDPLIFSQQQFIDDVPDEFAEDNWEVSFQDPAPPVIWEIQDLMAHSGSWSWGVEDVDVETRQLLQFAVPWEVTGDQPVLRFWHNYNTETGADGGLVDISTDGGTTWKVLDDEMFKNGYPFGIQYGTFVVPNLSAFSGNSGGWIPTYIDLSEYAGQEILFRFRFGTDDNTAGFGWFIDDVEFMDMRNYNSEVCATSNEGDHVCAIAPDRGTIVDSQLGPDATTDQLEDVEVTIFPNPAHDFLNISLSSENQKDLTISVTTLDGRDVLVKQVDLFGQANLPLNVSQLPAGFYMVKVFSKEGMLVKKIAIQ